MRKISGILLCLIFNFQATSAQEGKQERITVFRNVNLIPMTSEKVVPGQTVVIRNDRITEIGSSGKINIPKDAEVIDGTGKYLMPGLADMHVHLGGWDVPDVNLYLANGVTTVRDLTQGGAVNSIKRWCEDFNTKKRLGPTIYNAWTIWGKEVNFKEAVPLIQENGYNCLKVNDYLGRQDFYDIVRKAKELGIYTTGHIPYSCNVDDAIKAGMDELSHVEVIPLSIFLNKNIDSLPKNQWDEELLTNGFHLMESILTDNTGHVYDSVRKLLSRQIKKLKEAGVTVTTTLVADQSIALKYNDTLQIFNRPCSKYLPKKFWDDLRNGTDKNAYFRGREKAAEIFYDLITYCLGEIRKSGITIIAGTDAGPYFIGIVPGFSLIDELKLLTETGYSPFEALTAATSDASKVIERMTGMDDFGTIETGKKADLVLLGSNPLDNIDNIRSPKGVMTAGIWLPEPKLAELLEVKRKPVVPLLKVVTARTNSADSVIAEYQRIFNSSYLNEFNKNELILTTIGYDFLKSGRFEDAIKIFRLNTEEFPLAANTWDCLGEAYLKKGDKNLAKQYYSEAVTCDPGFESSLKILKELEN